MDAAEIEAALQKRSAHHDAKLDVVETDGARWTAQFVRDDGTVVLSADGPDREGALRALYELDELEDLAGG